MWGEMQSEIALLQALVETEALISDTDERTVYQGHIIKQGFLWNCWNRKDHVLWWKTLAPLILLGVPVFVTPFQDPGTEGRLSKVRTCRVPKSGQGWVAQVAAV